MDYEIRELEDEDWNAVFSMEPEAKLSTGDPNHPGAKALWIYRANGHTIVQTCGEYQNGGDYVIVNNITITHQEILAEYNSQFTEEDWK